MVCSDPVDEELVYEKPPSKYSVERILQILLRPKCAPNIVQSATYVVNITKLADPEDVKNDNFGVWKHSGSHPSTYMVNVEEDGYYQDREVRCWSYWCECYLPTTPSQCSPIQQSI